MATPTEDSQTPQRELKGRKVFGFGGPNSGSGSHDGQSALKLHRGISVLAFVLCVLVVVVFLLDSIVSLAIVFAVVALACVGIFIGTSLALRRSDGDH